MGGKEAANTQSHTQTSHPNTDTRMISNATPRMKNASFASRSSSSSSGSGSGSSSGGGGGGSGGGGGGGSGRYSYSYGGVRGSTKTTVSRLAPALPDVSLPSSSYSSSGSATPTARAVTATAT